MIALGLGGHHEHFDWAHAGPVDLILAGIIILLGVAFVGLLIWLVIDTIKGHGPFGDGQ